MEWRKFCMQYELDPLSSNSQNVVSYLTYTMKRASSSVSTAYSHMSAIAYYYRIHGRPSITEDPTVAMFMKGLKRRNLSTQVKRATPMNVAILHDMRQLVRPENHPNLVIWRTVWRASVQFGLMLRFDDTKR